MQSIGGATSCSYSAAPFTAWSWCLASTVLLVEEMAKTILESITTAMSVCSGDTGREMGRHVT